MSLELIFFQLAYTNFIKMLVFDCVLGWSVEFFFDQTEQVN